MDVARPNLFVDMATSLERAGFDYMMLEDASIVPDVYEGSLEPPCAPGSCAHDPMTLVPLLGQATEHIGIIATAATSFYPPFLAARLFTTLDHLTDGRVGVNLVTASPHARRPELRPTTSTSSTTCATRWPTSGSQCVKALWDIVGAGRAGHWTKRPASSPITPRCTTLNFEGRWFYRRGAR